MSVIFIWKLRKSPTVKNNLRELKRLFPDSVIIDNGIEMEYFFEKEEMIIRTPDRSEPACEAVAALKKAGLSGQWRSKTRNP